MRQSDDSRATVARQTHDVRERREAFDGDKCSQFHQANIVRLSREYRTNVVKHSPRFVRQSYDIRATVVNMS